MIIIIIINKKDKGPISDTNDRMARGIGELEN